MIVAIDANLVAAALLPLPYSDQATALLRQWYSDEVTLAAPTLLFYEALSVLRRHRAMERINAAESAAVFQRLLALGLDFFPPTPALGSEALVWAERLQQARIYDSAYVALADALGAPFWTADRRLVNGLRALGVTWAHWVGDADIPAPQ